ncbi:MAG: alpha/beta fold hydrolase [Nitrospirae bacterium]|nr:alpha/beta fold hydrolase [Nitrospirota bacterium]
MPAVQVRNVHLYYEAHGEGPPLLLITGLGLDVASWGPQIPALDRKFRVIVFDNRGAGRSSTPESPYTTAEMAKDAIALMDALEIEQAHVLGLSMGGLIAQELAISHPDRVKSLILATTAAKLPPRARGIIDVWNRLIGGGIDPEIVFREQSLWVFTERFLSDESRVSGFAKMFLSHPHPPAPRGFAGQAAACLAHDARTRLQRITVPTLVLVGREDIFFPVPVCEDLARGIPVAKLAVLDGGGHAFATEISEDFNRTVLEFLETVEKKTA